MGVFWRRQEGALIRSLRLANGLTQEQLAVQVGMTTKQNICGIERGRQHVPPERCAYFAAALNENVRTMAGFLLRWQSPFLFAGLFGRDSTLARELDEAEAHTGCLTRPRG